jgi:hypothetical protein
VQHGLAWLALTAPADPPIWQDRVEGGADRRKTASDRLRTPATAVEEESLDLHPFAWIVLGSAAGGLSLAGARGGGGVWLWGFLEARGLAAGVVGCGRSSSPPGG